MASTLHKETQESLHKIIADKRESIRNFRFEGEGSRRRNVREARNLRKEIARVMTELTQRKIAETKKTK